MSTPSSKPRPQFRNLNVFTDLPTYRLPAAGIVSILHRISGFLMFLLLPLVVWLFDNSVSSEIAFSRFQAAFVIGIGILPAWAVKSIVLVLIWAYLHHFTAGLRYLWMDVSHQAANKPRSKVTAVWVLVISLVLTAALGAKLFGLY